MTLARATFVDPRSSREEEPSGVIYKVDFTSPREVLAARSDDRIWIATG
jgi:hypothetical protein